MASGGQCTDSRRHWHRRIWHPRSGNCRCPLATLPTSGFNRSQAAGRRDELRAVLDDAAVLLATGATNLRLLQSTGPDPGDLKAAKEWMSQIFPIGQRLQLWLPHDDPVVVSYETVREQLVVAGSPGTAHRPKTRYRSSSLIGACSSTLQEQSSSSQFWTRKGQSEARNLHDRFRDDP